MATPQSYFIESSVSLIVLLPSPIAGVALTSSGYVQVHPEHKTAPNRTIASFVIYAHIHWWQQYLAMLGFFSVTLSINLIAVVSRVKTALTSWWELMTISRLTSLCREAMLYNCIQLICVYKYLNLRLRLRLKYRNNRSFLRFIYDVYLVVRCACTIL